MNALFKRLVVCWTGVAAMVAGSAAVAQTTVTEPWVRGTVATQRVTGAFMTLQSPSATRLLSVTSPMAGRVEIHEMSMVDGVMRMREVPALALPAGQAVALKPGGFHLMLMDLKQPIKQGDTVPLKLVLEGANNQRETLDIQAPVRPLGQAKPMH
jgi:periplasmic copper chaperone A